MLIPNHIKEIIQFVDIGLSVPNQLFSIFATKLASS